MNSHPILPRFLARPALLGALALCLAPDAARAAASIVIVNNNAPGVGFNDPTPVAAVGGNFGATLGEQRLNAFQHAADIWGATIDSPVEIRILASFEPLTCTAGSAVLGSAGTRSVWSDFPGSQFPLTWYNSALANKLSGADLDPTDEDITARFNVNLGNAGCLDGTFWYLGFDRNHGNNIDLVTVLLHEFAHGLGFQQFASTSTGEEILDQTDVYGRNLLDLSTGKTWDQMTNAERAASAINSRRVVWKGAEVTLAVPGVLDPGVPLLRVNSPAPVSGVYQVGAAAFGPQLSSPGVTADLALVDDGAAPTADACTPLVNPAAIAGRIAVLDRGTCAFATKVKNAQDAGAVGVIVVDNAAGSPPAGLGGSDPTIVIPSVRVTLTDGAILKNAMLGGTVNATLGVDLAVRAGADPAGRALINAPNPVQPGSSISHWDPIAFPNQLMEPSINSDLTHNVAEPDDLTVALFRDIGWFPGWGYTKYDLNGNGCVDRSDLVLLTAAIRARSSAVMYDLNSDGRVDSADSRLLVLRFTNPGGAPCPP
jgi:hypothetical protein